MGTATGPGQSASAATGGAGFHDHGDLFHPNISSCGHCVQRIKSSQVQLEGVRAVEADPEKRVTLIEFEPPATQEAIKALLEEIHSPVAQ